MAQITDNANGIGVATVWLFLLHGAEVITTDIQDNLGHSVCSYIGSDDSISYVHF